MLNWLVSTSLQLRVVVAVLAAVFMIAGIAVVQRAPLDVFPEFAPPLVEIQTEAPGLSTAEVESLVTVPVENALNGTSWLKTIRSKSVLGLSSVVLIFEEGTDLLQARQLVQERLGQVRTQLPAVASPPVMLSPLSSTSRVLKVGMTSKKLSQLEMSTLARWTIRPRLMAISGVANVAIWGQRDRQLQVLVDPDRLRANNVTLEQVLLAARGAASLGAGGFVDTPNQRLAVTHISPIREARDLAQVPVVHRNGAALTLGDVADVVEGHQAPIGDAVINDEPGILLIVEKQPWGNTLDVTRKVEQALDAMRPGLKDVEVDSTIFRPATFIEMSLANLNRALVWGLLLVVVVLVFFLYEWRTAVISLTAIPLSLVAAAVVLYYYGATINTMVLAGLVIALGEVVDDAIIDVENIVRRLRQNRAAGNPESAMRVVLAASIEVRSAIVFASLIIVMVFLPVFLLPGLAGSFFRPLATSYVLAVLASLGVALTVTPALSLLLLPRSALERSEAPLVRWMKGKYRAALPRFIIHPQRAVAFLAVVLIATAAAYTQLGEEFMPKFKEYDFLMHWVEKPGTSLEAMQRITVAASKELRAVPGVRNFGSHIGRAEVADEVVGPNFTELWISLDPKVDYDPTVARIQEIVDGYPGLTRDLLTYLKERIKEVLTGAGATIVVRIYGPNLETLQAVAQQTAKAMGEVQGVADLKVEQQVLVPQIEVELKTEAAQRFGLTPGDVRRAATTLVKGTKAGEIYEEQKIFDVVVWGTERIRRDPYALRDLRVDLPGGTGQVPLGDLASIRIAPTPNAINRESASRRIDVTCNVRGRDLGSVAREIEARVRQVAFPQGYHPELLGEYAARQESERVLLAFSGLSLLGIFLLLHADFGSTRLATLVMVSIPFALVGGVAGAFVTGGVLSLGSLVGFVTVLGIAARNGIMLVSHYKHLETEEGQTFGPELVLRGAEERLAPIMMTALATALALLPIALGGNKPGQEIEHPMAVVILGGLVTSTILNVFLMPALYLRFGKRSASND